jgi:hypothetical protein
MKMSDILRKIADEIEHTEGGEEINRPENSLPHAGLEKVGVDFEGDGMKDEEGNGTTMVPPLQQKLELLKKAAGEDSMYDTHDELDDIKKLTGIQAVIHHIDDSDLEGQ